MLIVASAQYGTHICKTFWSSYNGIFMRMRCVRLNSMAFDKFQTKDEENRIGFLRLSSGTGGVQCLFGLTEMLDSFIFERVCMFVCECQKDCFDFTIWQFDSACVPFLVQQKPTNISINLVCMCTCWDTHTPMNWKVSVMWWIKFFAWFVSSGFMCRVTLVPKKSWRKTLDSHGQVLVSSTVSQANDCCLLSLRIVTYR